MTPSEQSNFRFHLGMALVAGVAAGLFVVGIVAGIDHAAHNEHLLGPFASWLLGFAATILGGVWGGTR